MGLAVELRPACTPVRVRIVWNLQKSTNCSSTAALRADDSWRLGKGKAEKDPRGMQRPWPPNMYVDWPRRFLSSAQAERVEQLDADRARAFLDRLAVVSKVAASTQNQALNAPVWR